MRTTLLIYSSTDGHTRAIAERIATRFEQAAQPLELVPADALEQHPPDGHAGIIAGAPVRYGKHDPRVIDYLEQHAETLTSMPNAFFSVNLVARTPEKRNPETNSHVRKFLEKLRFRPAHVEVIAGRLDYPAYRWLDRQMIRLIMKMTGGPTSGTEVIDYTDWDQVDRFGDMMAARCAGSE